MGGILEKEKNLRALHLHMTDEVAHVSIPIFWRRLRKLWDRHPKVIFQAHIWISRKKKDVYHRTLYSNIDEVWCSSHQAKDALTEAMPSNVQTLKIFNYGRNINKMESQWLSRDEARKSLGLKEGRKTLGTVSRIEKAKGIRELVEASVPLLDQDPNLEVVVVGGPSANNGEATDYFEELKRDVARLPEAIRSRIIFCGVVPESHRILKAFDVYVLPSYLECFSLSLLDAQLAGLPTVGSQSGGTPEIVKPGQTGWLFEPENVGSLRKSLTEALSRPEVWNQYGKSAHDRVKKEFDQNKIFEEMTRAYEH
jgi:glycosyltransferase involved in cell wall biosynthesis